MPTPGLILILLCLGSVSPSPAATSQIKYAQDGQPNDSRNWHVALLKGAKYHVAPALLIAIRSQENPWVDGYALGVTIVKDTDIWTQYEWGSRTVAKWAKAQGWSPLEPTPSRLLRLGRRYVGRTEEEAKHWARSVWWLYKKALGQMGTTPNLK